MDKRRVGALMGTLGLVVAACGGTTSPPTTEALSAGAGGTTTSIAATTTATPAASTTSTSAAPTTTVFDRLVELQEEPPPFEEVTITTEDEVDLYARFWPGTEDVAVLFGHDFSNNTPGSFGQRAAQSSETVLIWSGAVANEGWTVLSPDFRGHGQSGGEYDVRASQVDLTAAHDWLREAGYSKIIVMGWVGSGTAAAVLDATEEGVTFDGLAMIFSPLQDTGLDGQRALSDLDIPTYFIGIDTGSTARAAKFLERAAVNSLGITVFDRVPSGLQFVDVYGPELAGRLLQFLDDATA